MDGYRRMDGGYRRMVGEDGRKQKSGQDPSFNQSIIFSTFVSLLVTHRTKFVSLLESFGTSVSQFDENFRTCKLEVDC